MPRLSLFSLLAALFFLLPVLATAQAPGAVITGTVTDAETGEPLEGVNVFIATSMIGTATDAQGRYRLDRVPLGAQRLFASALGYKNAAQDVMLREPQTYTFDFKLEVDPLILEEVTVEAQGDPNWKRRLEKFTRLFIGETPNATETVIVNPEVLDFEEDLSSFRARAAAPLVIENKALGYRVQYFLKEFESTNTRTRYDGEPLYEEMMPESTEQAKAWDENRQVAFYGSFRHFLLALIANRLEEQGFHIFSRPTQTSVAAANAPSGRNRMNSQQRYPIKQSDVLKSGETPNERTLDFSGAVEIIYTQEKETQAFREWQRQYGASGMQLQKDAQTSWITLETGPTTIDLKGDILNPYGVTLMGFFAFERVADELPREYRPWN